MKMFQYKREKVNPKAWANIIFVYSKKEFKFLAPLYRYVSKLRFNLIYKILDVFKYYFKKYVNNLKLDTQNVYRNSVLDKFNKKLKNFRLRKFKNKHRGERCFIIGNGPSLKKTDLSFLKNEYTFGLNRIYLLFKKLGFETDYLVSINKLVLEQCATDFKMLNNVRFFNRKARKFLKLETNLFLVDTLQDLVFSKDIRLGVAEGATVTYVAMQIAYFMGFDKVILVGVDHSFKSRGEPHSLRNQVGDDPNHFSKKYFKGLKWQLPDLETSEKAYRLAKKNFEEDGREIVDATIGGKLDIFKKVRYESLF